MENVLEAEAIEAGLAGDRVLRHLENLHPKEGAAAAASSASSGPGSSREPGTPNRRAARGGAGGSESGRAKKRHGVLSTAKQEVTGPPSPGVDVAVRLRERYSSLPAGYTGPSMDGGPSAEGMALLLRHVKTHIVQNGMGRATTPAVPGKIAVELLIAARKHLEMHASSLVELSLSDGRIVVVGDTHGQVSMAAAAAAQHSKQHTYSRSSRHSQQQHSKQAAHIPQQLSPLPLTTPPLTTHHSPLTPPFPAVERLLLDTQSARATRAEQCVPNQRRCGRSRRLCVGDLLDTIRVHDRLPWLRTSESRQSRELRHEHSRL